MCVCAHGHIFPITPARTATAGCARTDGSVREPKAWEAEYEKRALPFPAVFFFLVG